jgi:hypothetical protein
MAKSAPVGLDQGLVTSQHTDTKHLSPAAAHEARKDYLSGRPTGAMQNELDWSGNFKLLTDFVTNPTGTIILRPAPVSRKERDYGPLQ